MHVLAISGSVRPGSYNTALLKAATSFLPDNMELALFGELASIPIFQPHAAEEERPEAVKRLATSIGKADGIILGTPEYAHGIPGVLKNALDWLVASGEWVLKPVAVTSVSTTGLGGARSHDALVRVLTAMNANVVVDASLNVPWAKNKFSPKLALSDEITAKALTVSLLALERAINDSA